MARLSGGPGNTHVLVEELARDDSLYVLVENPSEQAQALSIFQSWGVNTDHCRFITADTWSHWTRDWGPTGSSTAPVHRE